MQTILLTGVAGFIGSHVAKKLLERGDKVIGIDNMNDYYDVSLKKARIKEFIGEYPNFRFYKADISDLEAMDSIFKDNPIDRICHLAAQPGVRYSLEAPFAYLKANMDGTLVIFEMARKHGVKHIAYASSSSVYGGNKKTPFSTEHNVDRPVSLYAATKKANELMAYTYHHLFGIKMRGLRYFTVYGPWSRPDMAMFLFTKNILAGKPIDVYNYGKMKRDFTYIDDIRDGTILAIDSDLDYEIFNLAYGRSVELMEYIKAIEDNVGIKAKINLMKIQPGDVPATSGDIEKTKKMLGYDPKTPIEVGIKNFCEWYKNYHS